LCGACVVANTAPASGVVFYARRYDRFGRSLRGLPSHLVCPGGPGAAVGAEHPGADIAGELLSLSPYGITALNHHGQHLSIVGKIYRENISK